MSDSSGQDGLDEWRPGGLIMVHCGRHPQCQAFYNVEVGLFIAEGLHELCWMCGAPMNWAPGNPRAIAMANAILAAFTPTQIAGLRETITDARSRQGNVAGEVLARIEAWAAVHPALAALLSNVAAGVLVQVVIVLLSQQAPAQSPPASSPATVELSGEDRDLLERYLREARSSSGDGRAEPTDQDVGADARADPRDKHSGGHRDPSDLGQNPNRRGQREQ